MWLRIGIFSLVAFGPVSAPAQVTNPRPMRSTIIMMPATYAGETFNAMQFDPRADGILYLWPRTAVEGGGSGGGGTNVAGITNINGLTNASQTFATGTAGTDFNIASSVDTHTFHLPTAGSGSRGLLASGDWSTFNNKQGAITVQTGGVTVATIPTTWNFTAGITGYVSGSQVFLGNSVAGGGDVTTAQLLYVSNQVQVASNVLQADVNTRQGGSAALTNLGGNPYVQYTNINAFQATSANLTAWAQYPTSMVASVANVSSNALRADVTPWVNLTTNKVVTTNDQWLITRGSNGVVVAAGAGISVASSGAGGQQTFTVTASGGSGSPGGNSGAVQFNEGGAFEGTNEFLYDRTNKFLMVTGLTAGIQVRGIGSHMQIGAPTSSGTSRWDLGTLRLVQTAADPSLSLSIDEPMFTSLNSLSLYTNRVRPLHSNHTDFGQSTFPWRTLYADNVNAAQSLRLGFTNGGSGTIFTNAGLFKATNVIILNITNPVAGQVLKIATVTAAAGGTMFVTVTNDTDATGGGGGGGGGAGSLPMDLTQFSTNGTAAIKDGALLTNITVKEFITLTNGSTPAIPPTNHLVIGKDSYAGRGVLESWDDNGLSIAYQPAFMNNRITMFQPSATTVIGSYGLTVPVNLGGVTVSHPPPTEQWPYMVQLATPATSNACAGTFSSIDMTTMGTRYGRNGYFLATEFMTTNLLNQHTKTAPAGNRLFLGRTSTASPNLTNIVNTTNGTGQYAGLYCDSGYTNEFYLTVRDGTAEFRTNTGIFYVATNLYQFYMMQAPTSKMLAWKLKDMTSNTVAHGWFSNNVPTNNMKFGYLIRNGTTVVNSVRFTKMYVEAPLSP